jgi:hypothetical protein
MLKWKSVSVIHSLINIEYIGIVREKISRDGCAQKNTG